MPSEPMPFEQDTIVAVATPPGRGGIGVVRLSGPRARAMAEPLCRLRSPLAAGHARFAEIIDEAGVILDEAVVTYFAAPHSYTSEDVVEISAHGAPVLLEWLVRQCLAHGARLAEPGEFTQRAFLSGRLDLTQAEAVNDLISAQTLAQARLAAAQLGGSVSQAVAPSKQQLIALIAELEAGVDFAEDDLNLLPPQEIIARMQAIGLQLRQLAATYSYGRILREGLSLAIVGRPNAGKSSLFNRLLERERAIVTAQPGTTRDVVSESLSLDGIPVELMDTAGLREAEGEAEAQGIVRTHTTIAEADFILLVIDGATLREELRSEDRATLARISSRPHLVVLNKADLVAVRGNPQADAIWISTRTGEGLNELRRAITFSLFREAPSAESAMLTNLRQHNAIADTLAAMERAQAAAQGAMPHEFLLLDLYAALEALDRLTGATSTDDVLNLIFSRFCIGK